MLVNHVETQVHTTATAGPAPTSLSTIHIAQCLILTSSPSSSFFFSQSSFKPHLDEIKPLWVSLLAMNLLCNYLPSRGWVSLASLFHHMSSCIGDIFLLEKICSFPSSPTTKQQFSFSKYFSPFLFLFSFSWTEKKLISLLFYRPNISFLKIFPHFPSSPTTQVSFCKYFPLFPPPLFSFFSLSLIDQPYSFLLLFPFLWQIFSLWSSFTILLP